LNIHHRHYSGNYVVSEYYLNEEVNNTPFFLIRVIFAISLGYLVLPLDLFIVQLTAMSISFYVHLYFDKHYHVAGSWLGRFAWFRRKQQLHFLHHRYADCNFAVVDNFWDWLSYAHRRSASSLNDIPEPFAWAADPDKVIAAVKRGYQVLDSLHLDALIAGDTFGDGACAEFCGCCRVRSLARHPPLSPASRATGG
jgi:hypothetical protein